MRGATNDSELTITNQTISIHAPHAGCDYRLWVHNLQNCNFNPRTPCGVRPPDCFLRPMLPCISIHAPHAGCDRGIDFAGCFCRYFNPRTPCGVRRFDVSELDDFANFNPRTPCGVRRQQCRQLILNDYISIHAPHAGCDICAG